MSVFAGPSQHYTNPDSIVVAGGTVFVGYQNTTSKTGGDHRSSTGTIVEYSPSGQVQKTFSVLGHNDGLRLDPATHMLWAMSDEDGNPVLTTIDPASGRTLQYRFPKTMHGGGHDDIVFLNGVAYVSASNPTTTNGVNTSVAIVAVTLGSAGQATVRPVLTRIRE